MPEPTTLALASLAAFAISLILAAVRIPGGDRGRRALGAASVVVGLIVGACVLGLAPRVPPRDVMDRLLLVVLPCVVAVEAAGRGMRYARPVVAVGAPLTLLFGSVHLADPTKAAPLVAALAAALDLAWWLVQVTPDRRRLTVLAVVAAGAGVAVVVSGYASGGMLGLPLAFGLLGAAAGASIPGRSAVVPGALAASVVGLFGLLVGGTYFAEMPLGRALLLLCAPLAMPLLDLVRRNRPGSRLPAATGPVLALALLASAILPAVLAYRLP